MKLLYLCVAILLISQVEDATCWGWAKRITGEVTRAVENAGREVQRASQQVVTAVEQTSQQIAVVVQDGAKEAEKFASGVTSDAESWFAGPEEEIFREVHEPLEDLPTVVRGCFPLAKVGVEFACRTSGRPVNCARPMAVGSRAQMRCSKAYVHAVYPGYNTITCTDQFTWSKPPFDCVPDCGKRNLPSAKSPDAVEVPWHVNVYKVNAEGGYDLSCGGSLFTPTLIITDGSCFWDSNTNTVDSPSNYKLSFGQARPHVNTTSTFYRDVETFTVHSRYLASGRQQAYNVAFVRLKEAVPLSASVNVVCVDWINEVENVQIADGTLGLIPSWANSDYNVLQLPYVPFLTCSDTIGEAYQELITHDKFCGGTAHHQLTVCPSDSGAGFAIPLDTVRGPRYYLRGVTSTMLNETLGAGICDKQQFVVLTNFAEYQKWSEAIVFSGTKT